MTLNFKRRYKWLRSPREDSPDALLFDLPSLEDFRRDLDKVGEIYPPRDFEDLVQLFGVQTNTTAADHLLVAQDALANLPSFIPRTNTADKEYDGRIEVRPIPPRDTLCLMALAARRGPGSGERTAARFRRWERSRTYKTSVGPYVSSMVSYFCFVMR